MIKKTLIGVIGCAAAASVAVPAAVSAAPVNNGAMVVASQHGVSTHRICASQDVYLVASGFAPDRASVVARVTIVGNGGTGALFYDRIQLVNGSGSYNTSYPGDPFIGAKFRVRYQTGSSGHVSNWGSFSATIVDC